MEMEANLEKKKTQLSKVIFGRGCHLELPESPYKNSSAMGISILSAFILQTEFQLQIWGNIYNPSTAKCF